MAAPRTVIWPCKPHTIAKHRLLERSFLLLPAHKTFTPLLTQTRLCNHLVLPGPLYCCNLDLASDYPLVVTSETGIQICLYRPRLLRKSALVVIIPRDRFEVVHHHRLYWMTADIASLGLS